MLQLVAARESRIVALDQLLAAPLSSCAMVSTGRETLPVLAISRTPEGALALVDWRADLAESDSPKFDDICLNTGSILDSSLSAEFQAPQQSKLVARWIELSSVAEGGGCLISFNCLREYPECAVLSHHWSPVHQEAAAGKGKDAKASKATKERESTSKPALPQPSEYLSLPPSALAIHTGDASPSTIPLLVFLQSDVTEAESEELQTAFVVVQELVSDRSSVPASFRIEVETAAALPMVSRTIHIPVREGSEGRVVLRLRALSPASLRVDFRCPYPMQLGHIDVLWTAIGGACSRFEGETPPTKALSEQIILRAQISASEEVESSSQELSVVVFHVHDRHLANRVSLLVTDESGMEGESLASLEGSLIATTRHPRLLVARCLATNTDLPSVKWTLYILSKQRVQVKSLIPDAPPQRFSGGYIPNNRLLLFRDVISVDKSSQPLALRLGTSATSMRSASVDDKHSDNLHASIALRLCIYTKIGKKLLCELKGIDILTLYWLPLDQLLSQEDPAVATIIDKSRDKKEKTKKALVTEVLDLLFECFLDECAMSMPSNWRSPLPHSFDLAVGEDAERALEWNLDLIVGKVHRVGHDITDLERFHATKREWEERSASRTERAQAALAYFVAGRHMMSDGVSSENKEESVSLLSQALGKDASEMNTYEDALLEAYLAVI